MCLDEDLWGDGMGLFDRSDLVLEDERLVGNLMETGVLRPVLVVGM